MHPFLFILPYLSPYFRWILGVLVKLKSAGMAAFFQNQFS